MHLAILTQYYPPEIGAPQARLSELADHFVRRGHTVSVLTAMPNYPTGRIYPGYRGLFRRENRAGVDVIRTAIYPTQKASLVPRLSNYFSFVMSSAAIGSLALRRPDYLLVESPPLFLGLTGVWLSRVKRTRLIFNVSDLWPETAVRLGTLEAGSRAHRLSAALEKFCYRHAWLVTGQSKSIVADINDRFPECETLHLSNGADTDRFQPSRATAAARTLLGGGRECIALYAGLHGLAQGLDQLLAAARRLGEEGGIRLVCLGDGPEKQRLAAEAQREGLRNVRFLKPRPNVEMPSILAAADVLLITLKIHIPGAVPSKLYESMASGRPVVLVAEGEAADIVKQHRAGIVVAPGDLDGLTDALLRLRADPALRRELGDNGRRAARQHFDRTAIATRFIDHLETRCVPKTEARRAAVGQRRWRVS